MVANTEYLGLSGAARRFNIDGKSVHASTVFRWMRDGVKRGGQCIRLAHVRMGRRLATTPQFIEDFMRALAEADTAASPLEQRAASECQTPGATGKPRSAKRRAADIERARRDLAEAGIRQKSPQVGGVANVTDRRAISRYAQDDSTT